MAECDEVADLVMIGGHPLSPARRGFKVLRTLNDNRVRQVPLKPGVPVLVPVSAKRIRRPMGIRVSPPVETGVIEKNDTHSPATCFGLILRLGKSQRGILHVPAKDGVFVGDLQLHESPRHRARRM